MVTVGKKVVRAIKWLGLTREQGADVMDIHPGSIASYSARDNANPSQEKVLKLVKYAEEVGNPIPLGWFYDGEDTEPPVVVSTHADKPEPADDGMVEMPMKKVPIVGAASAGPGTDGHGDEDELEVPEVMYRHGLTGWRVEGDSMYPWLVPGDIVLVRETKREKPGYAFLVRTQSGEVRVKMLAHDPKKGFVFRSVNRDRFPDEELATGELIGLVTGHYHAEGTEHVIRSDDQGLKYKVDLI